MSEPKTTQQQLDEALERIKRLNKVIKMKQEEINRLDEYIYKWITMEDD